MATFIFRSNKAVHALVGCLCLLLMVQKGASYDFVVGGQKGWSVPNDPSFNPFNQWAEKNRFQVGDSLVFNYQSGQDSVLYVKSEDYASCNTDSPYSKFSDGHTVFKLDKSGPHFFISGSKDKCLKNEKLTVIVLAERNKNNNQSTNASPPSPQSSSSSPAPTTGQEGQSPSSDTNQTPSPVSEPPPPNAAASAFVSLAGSVGAFMVSVIMLLSF
ncbi:early nodulin-like protein 3 [Vigna radiata var. radiata]|uniref:Early nodulin-like protein 3 n=1 Tax=Vigna radiata var. radiata TaxID=3916 RepID=A0A1S3TI39_VIGRR|nr:early nodulin-like protein 3 [Vigna radiata var. radiata]